MLPNVEVGVLNPAVEDLGVLGQDVRWSRLELAILQDREAHAAIDPPRIVDADALIHRGRVMRVGQVAGLRHLDGVDPHGGHLVPALVLCDGAPALVRWRRLAALAPHVPVVDVVIVGNERSRDAPEDLSVRPAEHVPLMEHIQRGFLEGVGLNPEATGSLVELVTQEQRQVRLVDGDVAHNLAVRKAVVGIAAEDRGPQWLGNGRLSSHRAGVLVLGLAARQRDSDPHAVLHRTPGIPLRDPESRRARERVDRRGADNAPCAALDAVPGPLFRADLEGGADVGNQVDRRELRGELQCTSMEGILREHDGTEHSSRIT